MFKLNRMTDYAVVVLSQMAKADGGIKTASQLSSETGVPEPTVQKTLKQLTQGGILASQRGAMGGYQLIGTASEITVADIVAAMEGPIALTACVDGSDGDCGVQSLCPMAGNWNKVNSAIRDALQGVTLHDMMMPAWDFMPAGETIQHNGVK